MGTRREVARIAAWLEVVRMGGSREVARMAARGDLIRSRGRRALTAFGATQSRAPDASRAATIPANTQVMAGSNLVIELPVNLSRRSRHQRDPTRKFSVRN